MVSHSLPLVSIVSPVYNEAKYLAECIESVVAQKYQEWDYTIVDNCSTDDSLKIAQRYALKDSRIKVKRNNRHVGVVENHNLAFRAIAQDSKYCKLVSGDDWLYPECISRLVDLAEQHPAVGVVGAYAINSETIVRWCGLPYNTAVFRGQEICRQFLLGKIDSFWVPSSVLYRSSLVRSVSEFFSWISVSADLPACLRCLENSDFGFVHQILSFERLHDETVTAEIRRQGYALLDRLEWLHEFGPRYLTQEDYAMRREALLSTYFRDVLAKSFITAKRDRAFWKSHRSRLRALGCPTYGWRFARALIGLLIDLAGNPKRTSEAVFGRVRRRRMVAEQAQVQGPGRAGQVSTSSADAQAARRVECEGA
jgi:glycosyltransferase involved in cell wall biosynthesis